MKIIINYVIFIYLFFSPCTVFAAVSDPIDGSGNFAVSQHFRNFNRALGLNEDIWTLSGLINTIIPTLLIISGLILFGMLIMGGFEFLTAAADPKQAEKGQHRLTTAIMGFLIIFTAYWVTQIVEVILGVNILGN